ncbi:MAG: ATP-grasp domain-containing protein [Lachnoclostridium sp.]|nr:ATP-grasp domain-containing protein [Lachnoclostridium sp.]
MTTTELNILFLGGAKRVSMAQKFIQAGHERGINVNIYGYELNPYVPLSGIGDVITGLRWNDPGLQKDLEEVCKKYDINIMIPFVDGAVEPVARFTETHPEVFAPVSSPELSKAMFDKKISADMFEKANLPVPRTVRDVPAKYPVIAKPRNGSASKGIVILRNYDDYLLNRISQKDYLIQQYIPDAEEITCDCYVDQQGRIITISPRLRLQVAGGEVTETITTTEPRYMSIAHDVLTRLELRGAVTVQLISGVGYNELYLMEVNPRLGGGVVATINAGADIAGMIIDEYNENVLTPIKAKPFVLTTRYLDEVSFIVHEEK